MGVLNVPDGREDEMMNLLRRYGKDPDEVTEVRPKLSRRFRFSGGCIALNAVGLLVLSLLINGQLFDIWSGGPKETATWALQQMVGDKVDLSPSILDKLEHIEAALATNDTSLANRAQQNTEKASSLQLGKLGRRGRTKVDSGTTDGGSLSSGGAKRGYTSSIQQKEVDLQLPTDESKMLAEGDQTLGLKEPGRATRKGEDDAAAVEKADGEERKRKWIAEVKQKKEAEALRLEQERKEREKLEKKAKEELLKKEEEEAKKKEEEEKLKREEEERRQKEDEREREARQNAGQPKERARICPRWFSNIKKDLSLWTERGGIEKKDVEAANPYGVCNRIQIVDGKLYTEKLGSCHQTRQKAFLWGLLMLLRKYPGQVPDVDLFFQCDDQPRVYITPDRSQPLPVMLSYCQMPGSIDLPIPDFTFWGRPEVEILPWEQMTRHILDVYETNKGQIQDKRIYWRGNVHNGGWAQEDRKLRLEVEACSNTDEMKDKLDVEHVEEDVKHNETSRCPHYASLFMEGNSWSVGLKYTLLCGIPMLMIEPPAVDFFSRGLEPYKHMLPVSREPPTCPKLKTMIQWINEHEEEAFRVGRDGQRFVLEDLNMANVYDYYFNLFREINALLKFKPEVGKNSKLVLTDDFRENGGYYAHNLVVGPSSHLPCTMEGM